MMRIHHSMLLGCGNSSAQSHACAPVQNPSPGCIALSQSCWKNLRMSVGMVTFARSWWRTVVLICPRLGRLSQPSWWRSWSTCATTPWRKFWRDSSTMSGTQTCCKNLFRRTFSCCVSRWAPATLRLMCECALSWQVGPCVRLCVPALCEATKLLLRPRTITCVSSAKTTGGLSAVTKERTACLVRCCCAAAASTRTSSTPTPRK
mmetsp:Transcript_8083/g.18763  ORF Transcript_8083/g.18763 Transcript_8083/m.18763 type:complete len:205 (+) Transcript_8083:841-1455(+)